MSLLSVRNLGKSYRSYRSEWHRFARWFGMSVKPASEQWVLRDINFDINSGEAIGIVGQNGAGKSTLLKLITGTLQPTEGLININGRIAAILELGMGFSPELTGRQNVYHAAGLMGFTARQIEDVMSEIEAFAEIGDYFDKPVRIYSTGMQVRVAFAIATAYRPEILIVDEALSVGDTYFQHKSFQRIRDFQDLGTTLIIVSHDRNAIQALCGRAMLLDSGRVIRDGSPEEIFDFYNALIASKESCPVETQKLDDGGTKVSSGSGEALVTEIVLINSTGEKTESVCVGETVTLRINVAVQSEIDSLVLGYGIKDRLGQTLYGTNTWHTKQVINNPKVNSKYEFAIEFPANFGVGSYSVQTALVDKDTHLTANYEWKDLALIFHVVNQDKLPFVGTLWNEPLISIEKVSA
ncbi:MAG: ABC transporter ATP-binding protein [Halioglobus sp.]